MPESRAQAAVEDVVSSSEEGGQPRPRLCWKQAWVHRVPLLRWKQRGGDSWRAPLGAPGWTRQAPKLARASPVAPRSACQEWRPHMAVRAMAAQEHRPPKRLQLHVAVRDQPPWGAHLQATVVVSGQ